MYYLTSNKNACTSVPILREELISSSKPSQVKEVPISTNPVLLALGRGALQASSWHLSCWLRPWLNLGSVIDNWERERETESWTLKQHKMFVQVHLWVHVQTFFNVSEFVIYLNNCSLCFICWGFCLKKLLPKKWMLLLKLMISWVWKNSVHFSHSFLFKILFYCPSHSQNWILCFTVKVSTSNTVIGKISLVFNAHLLFQEVCSSGGAVL